MKSAREVASKTAPADWPGTSGQSAEPLDTRDILTAVGEVAYEWAIADDVIRWDANVAEVLGVKSIQSIATGHGFATLLDPTNTASRYDAVINGKMTDNGSGVAYEIQYALLPDGARSERRLIVEDTGRWYADETGRPARARGALRVINERYEREQRLAFLSRYDELTGLFNRSHLLSTLGEAIESAKRSRAPIAFMIMALDNFRAINEAYGFEVADQMFATVAQRIKSSLRDGDAIGRYSGNKLGVIVLNCDECDMHAAAERFHAAVRNDVIATEAGSVAVTASIGGVGLLRHGRTVNETLARAQEALHLARMRGHGHFAAYFHSKARVDRRRGNAELSSDLVAAFNSRRFVLGFQPIVDVTTREPVFREALIRMKRPNNPVSQARDFVELAERLGLIRLIDQRALELVFETLAATDARLSLNISAETVGDSEWLSQLSTRVAGRPDRARRLIIEITETAVMRNLDEATRFVCLLHDIGCAVAIDDFGAGFSSFRSLRELGVDLVKIDGAFVENLAHSRDDQVFARALVELARNFGIKTVAERVQDEESVEILAGWGVDYIQGTLTGSATLDWPETADAAEALVDTVG